MEQIEPTRGGDGGYRTFPAGSGIRLPGIAIPGATSMEETSPQILFLTGVLQTLFKELLSYPVSGLMTCLTSVGPSFG